MELFALPVLIFVTVLLIGLALHSPERQALENRLKVYGPNAITAREKALARPLHVRLLSPLASGLAGLVFSLAPDRLRQRTEERLQMADYPAGFTASSFIVLRLAVGLLVPLVYVYVALNGATPAGLREIGTTLFLLYAGNRVPDIWLSRQIKARRNRIEESLPDALDLITVCVEAGYGLDTAMAKVAEKTRGPLSQEFSRTLEQINLGQARREALRDLGKRAGVASLSSFVAAVVQADQMGTSIAQVMRIHADQMRILRRQRAEEKVMKAPIKMLFPLVTLIFPAIFVVILGSAVIRIGVYFGRITLGD